MKEFNFNEEIICDFLVTKKRKQVWASQLEILEVILDICKKENLKIIAEAGTLLGAIRHNGYIPWDDDLDFLMLREDYNKFIKVAPKYLPSHYFLQYYGSEKLYSTGHLQIRNSNTTCFATWQYSNYKHGHNLGVFVDIFPCDNIPDDEKKYQKFKKHLVAFKKRLIQRSCWDWFEFKSLKETILKCWYLLRFRFCSFDRLIAKFEKDCQKYNNIKTKRIALVSFIPDDPKIVFNADCFDEIEYHKFEHLEIPISKKWDYILTTEFGDYMKIPENKNGSYHGGLFFDLEKSYKQYKGLTEEEFNKLPYGNL